MVDLMRHQTGIGWTHWPGRVGTTWNPVVGCSKVSAGCALCYADELHSMRHRAKLAGKRVPDQYRQPFTQVQLMKDRLEDPLRTRKPRCYFVNSVSDWAHEEVPFAYMAAMLAVAAGAPQHVFLFLTKRDRRQLEFFRWLEARAVDISGRYPDKDLGWRIHHVLRWCLIYYCYTADHLIQARPTIDNSYPFESVKPVWPIPNAMFGVSVEGQKQRDRLNALLKVPAAGWFASVEPLLEYVDLRPYLRPCGMLGQCVDIDGEWWHKPGSCPFCRPALSWVLIGGESAKPKDRARPFDLAAALHLLNDCREAGVPPFMKQMGSRPSVPLYQCDIGDAEDASEIWEWAQEEQYEGLIEPDPQRRGWYRNRIDDGCQTHSDARIVRHLRDFKGENWDEWPDPLRVRDFPKMAWGKAA